MQKKQIFYFFLKMCIFIAIFMSLFAIIHKVLLVKSDGLYNYINFTEQPENSIDILILGSSHSKDGIRRLRNATNRINTAFFVLKNQITPHWIWYNRVD